MADTKYSEDNQLFDFLGLDLNRPVDSLKPGKVAFCQNIRSTQFGRIEPRLGLNDIAAVVASQTPAHSARRLNDPANSTYTRVIGAGTHLAYGQTSFTDLDSGYSGDPLALVPWTPLDSPSSFMYVADRSRMRKLTAAGALHTIGLAPPTSSPGVALAAPSYKTVEAFDATAGITQAGTAGAPATQARVATTISQILYDTGTTGWASVQPAAMTNIGEGMQLLVNSGGGTEETVIVQYTYPGSVATTIGSIIYDSGSTGLCSIVLATPIAQALCDALIRDTTVGENARIVAVIKGPGGTTSIRLSTTGTWAAADAIQVLPSFRTYYANNHAAAEALAATAIRSAVTSGTGTLTKTSALDLSLIATGLASQASDILHISFRVDRPDLITELKCQLDVDGATNDFTQNYYTQSFRPGDLTPAVRNLQSTLSTRQQVVQRTIIDAPLSAPTDVDPILLQQAMVNLLGGGAAGTNFSDLDVDTQIAVLNSIGADTSAYYVESPSDPNLTGNTEAQDDSAVSQQLGLGDNQFSELFFRISDFTRVGTDNSRTLQNVAAIRIVVICTGNVTVDMDAWVLGGGYGPDTHEPDTSSYIYRYRARNPATNVPSNFSPATRYAAYPRRQSVTITPTQYAAPSGTSLTTADFVLDIERFGGAIPDWHYVGTIANAASPSFTDTVPDDIAAGNPILLNDNYQPWPVIQPPASGTTAASGVSGTTVNDAATNFNTSWAPGTRILINAQPFTIYRVISTSRLELVENAGTQTSVTWRIDEPVLLAQPLACLWEQGNVFFACADPANPGRLYYSNPNSETTQINNYIDVTSPSEPLMNGVAYNLRSYVFSSENFFQILKLGEGYDHQKIPNGMGLFSRWALTREPAPIIAFLSKDGIYATTGNEAVPLTDADLLPLFPNEGNLGSGVSSHYTIRAPNIVSAQATNLRLTMYDDYLYFDYVDTNSDRRTLLLAFNLGAFQRGEAPGGWMFDAYTPGVVFHYGEEGQGIHSILCGGADSTTGRLYQYAGNSDNGTAIACILQTGFRNQGDPRNNKRYGDVLLDANTASVDVTATPYFNNGATVGLATTVNNSTRTQTPVPALASGNWQTALNCGLYLTFSVSTSSRPQLFIWGPRFTFEPAPLSALSWEIPETSFGSANMNHLGLYHISHVSTADLSLVVTIDGTAQTAITITHGSGAYLQTIGRFPVYKGKLMKVRLTSSVAFRLDTRASFIQVKPWASDGPYREFRSWGDYAMVEG